MASIEDRIDLVDGAFWGRNPHDELAWLRANAPVWRDEHNGVWGVVTYELVKYVSSHPDLFSSAGGIRPEHGPTPQIAFGRARVLRHPEPRPWVIVVHGARQGGDLDLWLLRARHLHRLGFNVALPVLPLHGPRQGDIDVPGFDVVANVTTALVAVAEIRLARRWIAEQSDSPVGVVGVSLGGYLTALTAGVEPDLDVVVAAVPFVSIHGVIARHLERAGGTEGRRIATLMRTEPVAALECFVDPRSFEPATPREHRHVVAGTLDRITTPHEALELARHWRTDGVRWFDGGHVGHGWSKALRADIDRALLPLCDDVGGPAILEKSS